jgi:hypothetical protein
MAEPTAALTFAQLQTEVAKILGTAYYGAAGTDAASAPTGTQDLADVKSVVNNGIRMLISDAPTDGWAWSNINGDIELWPTTATVNASGTLLAGVVTVTAASAIFYPTMENKYINIDGVDRLITSYTSSTVIKTTGAAFSNKNVYVTADGNYTLPVTFGGSYTGSPTYTSDFGRALYPDWCNPIDILRLRQLTTTTSDMSRWIAIRPCDTNNRRWEMMTYPTPSEVATLQLDWELYFDSLSADGDKHPAGFFYDEVVRAACLAVAERDGYGVSGYIQYYQDKALPNAYKINSRSNPRALGKMTGMLNPRPFGRNGGRRTRDNMNVTYPD